MSEIGVRWFLIIRLEMIGARGGDGSSVVNGGVG